MSDNGMTRQPNLPPWMTAMRQAAASAITEQDLKAIVQKQVEKAKEGDPNAVKFVFDLAMGGAPKGATFVQNINHFHGDEANPQKPTKARPRSEKKLSVLESRALLGEPLFNGEDGPHDDEE